MLNAKGMGVMNGLQTDLREKILVGSPDIRVLTYGEALRMERWQEAQEKSCVPPRVKNRRLPVSYMSLSCACDCGRFIFMPLDAVAT